MTPRTLKDLVPILEGINRQIKHARIAKDDIHVRYDLVKMFQALSSLDIETMVIESISLDNTGNVLANTLRNTLEEIVARIDDLLKVNPHIEPYKPDLNETFDKYEVTVLHKHIHLFIMDYLQYWMSLDGLGKLPLSYPFGQQSDISKEVAAIPSMVAESRTKYFTAKKKLMEVLQRSIDFEDNIEEMCRSKFHRLKMACNGISRTISKYYPPCDIVIPKMPTELEAERKAAKSGIIVKKSELVNNKKPSKEIIPWEGDVFPMALTSELYEISKDFFHVESEAAFHSALNLHYKYDPITAKKGHHNRVAYMVQQLFNLLPSHQNREWRDTFLDYVGVERSYYDSKSSHATSDDASKRSQRYVEELDTVLKNHRKRA